MPCRAWGKGCCFWGVDFNLLRQWLSNLFRCPPASYSSLSSLISAKVLWSLTPEPSGSTMCQLLLQTLPPTCPAQGSPQSLGCLSACRKCAGTHATSSFPARQKMSPRLSQRGIWATRGSSRNAGPQLAHSVHVCGRTCRQGQGRGGNLPGSPQRVEYQTHNPTPSPHLTQQNCSKRERACKEVS